VLDQTYSDFEFIVINDGSTDQTFEYLSSINDPRIRIVSTEGGGLVSALNLGFSLCRGSYIARMDADDICAPNRFQVQLDCFKKDQSIDIVCSDIIKIDKDGRRVGVEVFRFSSNDDLKQGLLYRKMIKPVVHPTVMMRRSVIDHVGQYRHYPAAEDHDFWLRCIDSHKFHRISEFLLLYRFNSFGVSSSQSERQSKYSMLSVLNYLVHEQIGIDVYIKYPDLLEDCGQLFEYLNSTMLIHKTRFDQLKQAIKAKSVINLIRRLFIGLILSGPYLLPRVRQKTKLDQIEKSKRMVIELLMSFKEIKSV